jgi:tyrosyl-tRNA synthetase
MTSVIEGLDGVQKMSKSLGNAIGVHEPAGEMYGKLMSISDELMWTYWTMLTDLRGSEIAAMQEQVRDGSLHPMQAKKNLAWTITRDFHSKEEADAVAENWAKMFQQRGVSEDVPVVKVERHKVPVDTFGQMSLPKLLVEAGLANSAGEATRKLAENAVSINGAKITSRAYPEAMLGESLILRLGKKSVRVEWM